ncbi:unnamed protein product [Orchesella dallaii]|uniref:Uncharacterized protein n=1 Tax=Orchesella dallaii TaxID=48710 RepID=A0ABP1RE50_9HEXA
MNPTTGEEYFYKAQNMLLSSCQFLRKIFMERWKEETGTGWESTEDQGKEVIEGLGPRIARSQSVQHVQKAVIAKGCLDEWDLSTLSLVLQHFGGTKHPHKEENEAVKSLLKIQNALIHQPKKKFSRALYNEKVDVLKKSLKALKIEEKDVKKIIEKAGTTSAITALELANQLFQEAESFLSKKMYDKAIECYGEAIKVPSLLPVHQGVAFEKRADLYLKQAKKVKQPGGSENTGSCQLIDKALEDGTEALEQNELSWKTHYILGQCFMLKSGFDKAIFHYKWALTISPTQQQVKLDLETCKQLAQLAGLEISNSDSIPNSSVDSSSNSEESENDEGTQEKVKETQSWGHTSVQKRVNASVGETNNIIRMFQNKTYFNDTDKTQILNVLYNTITNDVLYMFSWPFPVYVGINKIITQLYNSKCGKRCKPSQEDMKIRLCYIVHVLCGPYTPSEERARLKQAKKGLEMYPDNPDFHNVVATAHGSMKEYDVALHYVEQALVKWPNNLSLLFLKASFLEHSKAETGKVMRAYRHFVNLAPILHPKVCASYYALAKLHIGIANVCRDPDMRDRIRRQVIHLFRIGQGSEICLQRSFRIPEPLHQYAAENPNKQEVEAFMKFKQFEDDDLAKAILPMKMNEWHQEGGVHEEELDGSLSLVLNLWLLDLRAMRGSQTVAEVVRNKMLSCDGLVQALEQEEPFNEIEQYSAVVLMYETVTPDFEIFSLPEKHVAKMKSVVEQQFNKKCGVDKTGREDMRTRFCYVGFNLGVAQMLCNKATVDLSSSGVDLLKQGIEMYPDNLNYYQLLCGTYAYLDEYKEGLICVEKALEKFPRNYGILYLKAVLLQQRQGSETEEKSKEVIAAYKEFLSKAPKDHRKVPHAYYGIGCEYIRELFEGRSEVKKLKGAKMIKRYHNLGMEAEQYLMPSYLRSNFASNKGKEVITFLVHLIDCKILPYSSSASHSESVNGVSSILDKVISLPLTHNLKKLLLCYTASSKPAVSTPESVEQGSSSASVMREGAASESSKAEPNSGTEVMKDPSCPVA